MRFKKIEASLLLFILLSGRLLFGQDPVKEMTLSITDSIEYKINKVHAIYNWITSNVRYDVEAYLKGSSENKDPESTLRRRKGICYDYAALFNAMCASINIDSKIVIGYSKGPDFYYGGAVYRADHCWNAIKTDKEWIACDATWGSGYLEMVPTFFDLLKFKLFRIPYVNKKMKFIQHPTDEYFNISNDSLCKTHLPLDPIWQFTESPYTVHSFETDSLNKHLHLEGLSRKLDEALTNSETKQYFEEGIRGKEYNARNNFNISTAYLIKASEIDFNTLTVDSLNIKKFEESLEYYTKSSVFISTYKKEIDSVMKGRITFIKGNSSQAKTLFKKISKEYKSKMKSFRKSQSTLNSRYDNLLNRIDQYEKKESLVSKDSIFMRSRKLYVDTDSSAINNCVRNLTTSIRRSDRAGRDIDSSIARSRLLILKDSIIAQNLISENKKLGKSIVYLAASLETENNLLIFNGWSDLLTAYKNSRSISKSKSQNLTLVQNSYAGIILDISLLFSRYNNQLDLIRNFYKYTNDTASSYLMYEENRTRQVELYRKAVEITFEYRELNGKVYRLNDQVFNYEKQFYQQLKSDLLLFKKFEDQLLVRQKEKLKSEDELIKQTMDAAKAGATGIRKSTARYNAELKKKTLSGNKAGNAIH